MQAAAVGFLTDLVRFPAWWYSRGFLRAAMAARDAVAGYERTLGVRVWMRNILVPMFGRYDWQSRIISFFMRLGNVFVRGAVLALFAVLVLLALVTYVALPVVSAVFVLYHATALIS